MCWRSVQVAVQRAYASLLASRPAMFLRDRWTARFLVSIPHTLPCLPTYTFKRVRRAIQSICTGDCFTQRLTLLQT